MLTLFTYLVGKKLSLIEESEGEGERKYGDRGGEEGKVRRDKEREVEGERDACTNTPVR